jgi:hypothetical protein
MSLSLPPPPANYQQADQAQTRSALAIEDKRNVKRGEPNPNVTLRDPVFPGTVVFQPDSSATPANNGDLVIQITSNTSLTFKLKGSDGTVRSGSVTLS